MSLINLTSAQLRQAADLKERIASLNDELAAILGGSSTPAPASTPAKKGGMSAAGRAKVAAAQKLRWAKIKAAKGKTAPVTKALKKKGGMSAAGRARIVAAQKARWAKIKGAKPAVTAAKPAKKKFTMSAAAKAKISAAAKARWAKIKAEKK